MNEQLPSPDFGGRDYDRPNQNWICGRACEGTPCRIGPSVSGKCRATFECKPALETKEGETKGRYRCTRPKEHGGPCENGPLPDGTCGRPVPKCAPVRSLRGKRGVVTVCFVAATIGGLLLALFGRFTFKFISPGPLSVQHAGLAFMRDSLTAQKTFKRNSWKFGPTKEPTCAACHNAATQGPSRWVSAAMTAEPGPFDFDKLLHVSKTDMKRIDASCQVCHTQHNFHQPNVVRDHSCSACHREHQGSGRMLEPDDANCMTCHGDASVMQASIEKGKTLAASAFDYRAELGRVLFKEPRPERGYTQVFHSFADHPDFEIHEQKLKESDTLRFNHQRHFQNDIRLHGKQLDCSYCHKPDASGTYYQKISFESDCKTCHALQFDSHNADLTLPHGNPAAVRAFLRSLPAQYTELGLRRGITGADLDKFVSEQMRRIREQTQSGEDLERAVFFSTEKNAPSANVGGTGDAAPVKFAGCARCHQVTARGEQVPIVTKPVIPDRWFIRGNFDHSKHLNVTCEQCHDVAHSRDTANINLPGKHTCATCHTRAGGAPDTCATCHSYHAKENSMTVKQ
ncbi:MAG: hypothetical protein ACXWKG_09585 [Limisphaerales bacterium]